MRICLIAEGSYPYVTGGVSSWIHSLTQNLPEHEFIMFAIGAEEKQRGKFKYKLPSNLTEVHEIFLDGYLHEQRSKRHRFRPNAREQESLRSLISGDGPVDWPGIFDLLRLNKQLSAADIMMSEHFFDLVVELCEQRYTRVPFTEMFWTVRSMMLPLFLTIRSAIPEADLYHSVSTGYAGVIGALAKHLYNKPFLLTEHGIYSREREEEIIKADWVLGYFKDLWIEYFYHLSEAAYTMSDQVISLFERNRAIQVEIGCDANKIRIIPNGVKMADETPSPAEREDAQVRIGAIVRLVPIKDIKTMINSFALVKRQIPAAELYIMGPSEEDETYSEECRQLVRNLGVRDIHFTGQVNVQEYLPRMDIILLSSISEGMPFAVLEAMAAGKPCVTTDVGSCRELLYGVSDHFGQAGVVVPVMHYDQMAAAVISLCKSRALREEMGRNGYKRVRARYTHEQFIRDYRGLYQQYEEAAAWRESASN
ncbi:GT4 family glycosyltransferase PelF [Paenibacillus beijingensis]|uniref:Glycosyl transferase n=1 Tax=Paenibacillus beijingensis TaxID=1126833 RepID=A0A0D5NIY3_9BACL|nr:GT4 family glycosyltransferase PelF [Paenibacillus beijingensis]AJY75075.1 glycosyl transferase [Paenibacillus beijingensis]